jgi:hypothetical protein
LQVAPRPPARAGSRTEDAEDPAQVVERDADDVDAGVGVVDPVDRDLVDAQAGALGEDEELGVEEPGLVLDVGEECLDRRGPAGLEAALGVGKAAAQAEVEEAVVGPRDDLAPGSRTTRAPRARRVPIARSEWPEISGAMRGRRASSPVERSTSM